MVVGRRQEVQVQKEERVVVQKQVVVVRRAVSQTLVSLHHLRLHPLAVVVVVVLPQDSPLYLAAL